MHVLFDEGSKKVAARVARDRQRVRKYGEHIGPRVLSISDARRIRKLHARGVGTTAIARQYEVHSGTISNILRNRTYREDA